jgi:urea transport system substrate-binding protein
MHRRSFLAASAAVLAGGRAEVAVGLLLPLSGPEAPLGRAIAAATLMAVDEIGRRVTVTSADTGSDAKTFLRLLAQMLDRRVASVFGLCPAGAGQAMRTLLERSGGLFWDPAPTPGGECSEAVIHGGPTPFQSLGHLVPWLAENAGRRFLLVGGGPLAPVCRTLAADCGATVLEGAGFDRIRRERPDVVVSLLAGTTAAAFLRGYREAGFDQRDIPVASPCLSELVAAEAGPAAAGAIAAAPYFASWPSPANSLFLQRLRRRAGATATAAAEAAWFQMHLFAQALARLDGAEPVPVNLREAARAVLVEAPQGPVRLDGLHTLLWPRIAVAEPSGRFRPLAVAAEPLGPLPFWPATAGNCRQRHPDYG